jgi:hypothetical protein
LFRARIVWQEQQGLRQIQADLDICGLQIHRLSQQAHGSFHVAQI